MGTLRNFVTPKHKKTKRNYVKRMNDNKVSCMKVSKKYEALEKAFYDFPGPSVRHNLS